MSSNVTDGINLTDCKEAVQAAFCILDQIQGLQPDSLKFPAVGIMFLLLCDRFNVRPLPTLDKCHRMMEDSLKLPNAEHVAAIREYLSKELKL